MASSTLALLAEVDATNASGMEALGALVKELGATDRPEQDCYVMFTGADATQPCPSGAVEGAHPDSRNAEQGTVGGGGGGGTAGVSGGVTVGQINSLACLLDAVAVSTAPQRRCVPLLPAAGWTADRVALLPNIGTLLLLPNRVRARESALAPVGHGPPVTHASIAPAPPPPAAPPISGGEDSPRRHGAGGAVPPGETRLPSLVGAAAQAAGPGAAEAAAAAAAGAGGAGACVAPAEASREGPEREACAAVEAAAAELQRLRPAELPAWEVRRLSPAGHAEHRGTSGGGRQGAAAAGGGGPGGNGNGSGSHGGAGHHAGTRAAAAATAGPYVTLVDGVPAAPALRLGFRRVAVGGTFDRLHAGHELLLAATALVAQGFVFVGVTADALLANKSHRGLLQPYEVRAAGALDYLRAVRPGLAVEVGPLSDPKAPTLAELDPNMEALVVSVETLRGATDINNGRAARGFPPLTIVTVPVIGLRRGPDGSAAKLSSSGLRAAEAEAEGRGWG